MIDLIERAGGKLDGVLASIVATPVMRGLCVLFLKSSHEDDNPADISDYANPTLSEFQAIHDHTYEAYLVVSILLSLDRSIYGNIIKNLFNSYSMGTYQYPRTCSKMNNTIFR